MLLVAYTVACGQTDLGKVQYDIILTTYCRDHPTCLFDCFLTLRVRVIQVNHQWFDNSHPVVFDRFQLQPRSSDVDWTK